MEAPNIPNQQDLVRQAIADDLPEDAQTRKDWAAVFSLTNLLGLVTILGGMVAGLWLGFAKDYAGVGMWVVLATLIWGTAAISVARDGREVSLGNDSTSA